MSGNFVELLQVVTFLVVTAVALLLSLVAWRRLGKSAWRREVICPHQIEEIKKSEKMMQISEVGSLADYCSQTQRRSNLSFSFSLLFSSIGSFLMIISFIYHTPGDLAGTTIKAACGFIIDAVSILFFIQSIIDQRNVRDFFEKFRLDRLTVEAHTMISEIDNPGMRNELRVQLILKHSGIDKLLTGSSR